MEVLVSYQSPFFDDCTDADVPPDALDMCIGWRHFDDPNLAAVNQFAAAAHALIFDKSEIDVGAAAFFVTRHHAELSLKFLGKLSSTSHNLVELMELLHKQGHDIATSRDTNTVAIRDYLFDLQNRDTHNGTAGKYTEQSGAPTFHNTCRANRNWLAAEVIRLNTYVYEYENLSKSLA